MNGHTVTVSGADENGDVETTLHCAEVTESCRAWFECMECRDLTDEQSDAMHDNDGLAHGIEHQMIDGYWMTPSDQCLVSGDCWGEFDLNPRRYLPGTYPLEYDIDECSVYWSIDAPRHRIYQGAMLND